MTIRVDRKGLRKDGMPNQWTAITPGDLLDTLASPNGFSILGIDGRSRSGKSTLAEALAASREHVAIVHTDDFAWHHSFFDWDQLLVENILAPLRQAGPPLTYTPHAWTERGRPGAIEVSPGAQLVIVEGVAATRLKITAWYDATIWVDTNADLAMQRTYELDRDPPGFVEDWMRQENAHLERDKPWTRATAIASGTQHPGNGRILVRRS